MADKDLDLEAMTNTCRCFWYCRWAYILVVTSSSSWPMQRLLVMGISYNGYYIDRLQGNIVYDNGLVRTDG